ncbi:MAG: prolyl oligopeptidase family serine peptidase [bacterium]|nr:prolyl oligopeptidase family serine peptidase [bacterium]
MSQERHTFDYSHTSATRLDYLLSLPEGYDETDERWPLMLFLHGAGERGADLEAVKRHGPPKRLEQKNDLPFIVVSPQCAIGRWWSDYTETLIALLDDIISRYAVDTRRVYLTGLSMGGFGTWHLAYLYPQRFAAVVPICGGMPWYVEPADAAEVLKDKPLWVFHGDKDEIVPISESQQMVAALKAAGSAVKFTIYPETGHNSWTKTYDNPELYDWFLAHQLP